MTDMLIAAAISAFVAVILIGVVAVFLFSRLCDAAERAANAIEGIHAFCEDDPNDNDPAELPHNNVINLAGRQTP